MCIGPDEHRLAQCLVQIVLHRLLLRPFVVEIIVPLCKALQLCYIDELLSFTFVERMECIDRGVHLWGTLVGHSCGVPKTPVRIGTVNCSLTC